MKPKEHTRQVKDKVVRYGKNIQSFEQLFNPWSENWKSVAQLQTYQDMAVHLNWLAGQGEHRSEKQPTGWKLRRSCRDPQLRWKNLSTGQLLVMHSTNRAFMEEWQEESHCWNKIMQVATSHAAGTTNMWSKVLWSDETKIEVFGPNAKCYMWQKTLHITLNTPSPPWNMVVAASCCGDAFLQQGQGSWSELMGRWMEPNTGQSWKKTCSAKTGVEVHLPAGQWALTYSQSYNGLV